MVPPLPEWLGAVRFQARLGTFDTGYAVNFLKLVCNNHQRVGVLDKRLVGIGLAFDVPSVAVAIGSNATAMAFPSQIMGSHGSHTDLFMALSIKPNSFAYRLAARLSAASFG